MARNNNEPKNKEMYAAIDIGSNAARLLIKSIGQNADGTTRLDKVCFFRYPLRLGDDVFTKGKIGKEKRRNITRFIKSCKQLMLLYQVDHYRACATSAMRDAKNGAEIIEDIVEKTDIRIEIIDGREEAAIIYGNHIEMASKEMRSCAYVDVGGGSTEVTIICNGRIESSKSYNIGTLRMLHQDDDRSGEIFKLMRTELGQCSQAYGPLDIVGSGGNINKIYKLTPSEYKSDGRITPEAIDKILADIAPLTVDQRMVRYGLKPDRADVIVPAAKIFLVAAQALRTKYFYVPTLGLADGIIDRLYIARRNTIPDVNPPLTDDEGQGEG